MRPLREGKVKKDGRNPAPTTPRPKEHPVPRPIPQKGHELKAFTSNDWNSPNKAPKRDQVVLLKYKYEGRYEYQICTGYDVEVASHKSFIAWTDVKNFPPVQLKEIK